ncbi:UUP1 family membrane protein [Pseudomonas lini]
MRSLTLHLKLLIAILVVLGISVTAYQIFVLGIPVTEDATDDLWNIDAKVEFVANAKDPIKIQMFVPPLSRDYVSLNESFISNNYGVAVNRVDGNRKVTWSARRAKGNQTLYYRLVLTKRYSGEKNPRSKARPSATASPSKARKKIAADALLAPIRQHSADVETFIGEAIKRVNNLNDDNVKLLLAGDPSTVNKAKNRRAGTVHRPCAGGKRSTPSAWWPISHKCLNSGCAASTAPTGCTSTRKPANRACLPTACCGGPATKT